MAKNIARRLYYEKRQRFFFLTPHDDVRLPGVPVIRSADVRRYEMLGGRSALVVPDGDGVGEFLFRFVWSLQEGGRRPPVWLIVDEIDLWLSAARPDPDLMNVVRYGRNRLINLVGVFQRCANVHNDLLSQADDKIIFQVTVPNDLAYLQKYAGADVARVQSLARYDYVHLKT
jgi:hypothetical protein